MSECDSCEDCSCGNRKEVELCETCGGLGQVLKKPTFLKLTGGPKETIPCGNCNGTGIKQKEKPKGW